MWHVIQDPASNQFFRLNEAAYQFVAFLDGRRTVADAWKASNEVLGDQAPTQGEAIQLLGQLYVSNLLQADLPPDAESLFARYRQRVTREVQGYLMNILFLRIPVLDPDHFLERWVRVFGVMFSWPGLAAWLVLVGVALYSIAGRATELVDRASGVLGVENLPYLYVSLVIIKVVHEFGHAFACKKFGYESGTGGEVHVMGVMFLIFTPLPYVDASSAWAFRSKWHRMIVGAGGVFVEMAMAAVAAIVWANTAQGATLHSIGYNMMFVAGVSTVLFNGNPLLRYDGYYILSDLLEMPNLAQRATGYISYLVRRYAWGVRRPQNPAHSRGESWWLGAYGVSSTVYRTLISIGILLFVANKLFFIGMLLAVVGGVAWVFVPLGKLLRYLATSGELDRVRARAAGSTAVVLGAAVAVVGFVRMPDRYRVEGVVEPVEMAFVYAEADGFVREVVRGSGARVSAGDALLRAENPDLAAHRAELLAERERLAGHKRVADTKDLASAQALAEQIRAVDDQIRRAEEELAHLTVRAPLAGEWVAPDVERLLNAHVRRGEKVGLVASVDRLFIRAVAGQDVAAAVVEEVNVRRNDAARQVGIRVKGRADLWLAGRITKVENAGKERLPSAALGYAAGGSIPVALSDARGTKAAEQFFEILVEPEQCAVLRSGQRVVVRTEMPSKPLAAQWWRALLRLLQRRFQI